VEAAARAAPEPQVESAAPAAQVAANNPKQAFGPPPGNGRKRLLAQCEKVYELIVSFARFDF
jgi:hypothetical protein